LTKSELSLDEMCLEKLGSDSHKLFERGEEKAVCAMCVAEPLNVMFLRFVRPMFSVTCLFSTRVHSSTPPASTLFLCLFSNSCAGPILRVPSVNRAATVSSSFEFLQISFVDPSGRVIITKEARRLLRWRIRCVQARKCVKSTSQRPKSDIPDNGLDLSAGYCKKEIILPCGGRLAMYWSLPGKSHWKSADSDMSLIPKSECFRDEVRR